MTSFDFGTVIAELNWLNLKDELLVRIAERSHPLTPGKKWSSPRLRQRPAPECVCEAGISPWAFAHPKECVPGAGPQARPQAGELPAGRKQGKDFTRPTLPALGRIEQQKAGG